MKDGAILPSRALFPSASCAIWSLSLQLESLTAGIGNGYLTHRIRRLVYGAAFDSICAKPVVVPLLIPQPLETYMERLIGEALNHVHLDPSEHVNRIIVPVHEIGHGTHILPDLHDTSEAKGNVRYWLLGTQTMWAGIDRRLDECVLRCLY